MTPLKAIRKVCVACVCKPSQVHKCGGNRCLEGVGDENGVCYFYPYRMGKGRPSVKLIRKYCLECMGGSKRLVAECRSEECPLHQYRFGKNPKRAGLVNKGAFTSHREPLLLPQNQCIRVSL